MSSYAAIDASFRVVAVLDGPRPDASTLTPPYVRSVHLAPYTHLKFGDPVYIDRKGFGHSPRSTVYWTAVRDLRNSAGDTRLAAACRLALGDAQDWRTIRDGDRYGMVDADGLPPPGLSLKPSSTADMAFADAKHAATMYVIEQLNAAAPKPKELELPAPPVDPDAPPPPKKGRKNKGSSDVVADPDRNTHGKCALCGDPTCAAYLRRVQSLRKHPTASAACAWRARQALEASA